jgi:hypothetical protein
MREEERRYQPSVEDSDIRASLTSGMNYLQARLPRRIKTIGPVLQQIWSRVGGERQVRQSERTRIDSVSLRSRMASKLT